MKYFLAFGLIVFVSLCCGSAGAASGIGVTPQAEAASAGAADAKGGTGEEAKIPPTAMPQPTNTAQAGTRRDNPAPAGATVVADDMQIVVHNFYRPANGLMPSFASADPGKEYAAVYLSAICSKDPNQKCHFSTYNFKLLGVKGVLNDTTWTGLKKDTLESKEFFGGSTLTGGLSFEVDQDDSDFLLVYDPLIFGDEFYLALPEAKTAR